MDPKVILSKQLWKNVHGKVNLRDLYDSGLELKTIKKNVPDTKFNDVDKYILSVITKTRPNIIRTILAKPFWEDSDNNKVFLDLMYYYKPTVEEIDVHEIHNKLSKVYVIKKGQEDDENSILSKLIEFGYKDKINSKVIDKIVSDNKYKFIEEANRDRNSYDHPYNDTLIILFIRDKFKNKFSRERVVELFDNLALKHVGSGLNVFDFEKMRKLSEGDVDLSELIDKMYNQVRNYYLERNRWTSFGNLVVKKSKSWGSDIDISKTLKNLAFFKFSPTELTYEDLTEIFDENRYVWKEDLKKIIGTIESLGYQTDNDDFYNFVMKMEDDSIDKWKTMIECGQCVDKCYSEMISWAKQRSKKLSDSDKKTLDTLLKGKKKYLKEYENINSIDILNGAFEEALRVAEYHSHKNSYKYSSKDLLTPQKWYDKYKGIIFNYDYNNFGYQTYYDQLYKFLVGFIAILTKLNKFDEIKNIKFNFFKNYNYSYQTSFVDSSAWCNLVTLILGDNEYYNGNKYWEIEITDTQKKKLVKTILDIYDPYFKENPSKEFAMAAVYYKYDKKRLNKLLEYNKTLKNNQSEKYTSRKTGEELTREFTNRFTTLSYLFKYIGDNGDIKDIDKILSDLVSDQTNKITKLELKRLEYSVPRIYGYNKDREKRDEQIKKTFSKYLENRSDNEILKFSDFLKS